MQVWVYGGGVHMWAAVCMGVCIRGWGGVHVWVVVRMGEHVLG